MLASSEIKASRIREAIEYALFPGGKRLRPMLVYLCGEITLVAPDALDAIAAAIELTHCYSLIHDDLPAMDNDDFRRGKPSLHRKFDEATAILVGDGMQALAIDILLEYLPRSLDPINVIQVTQELVKASGPAGMVSGQSLDLTELANPNITMRELNKIHVLKTGKLISACIQMVLYANTPSIDTSTALTEFAQHLGLFYQMQDDYLDQYADVSFLGKGRSSDAANKKTTFATLFTKEQLQHSIHEQFLLAEAALYPLGTLAHALIAFLHSLHQRMNH
jgi:farnesyl diphosphate synthase